jgi:alanyl-tRNA synthetase
MTRVEFVCGMRALADYRQANNTASAIARMLSAERDTTPELVAKALQESKSLKKRQRELLNLAMTAEAAEILKTTQDEGGFKLVQAIFDQRDGEELRVLASKITSSEPAVVLLASRDETARLVFARSASLSPNMGELLAEACQTLGGRGGGKPDMAQGGGPLVDKLNEAIKTAADKVLA